MGIILWILMVLLSPVHTGEFTIVQHDNYYVGDGGGKYKLYFQSTDIRYGHPIVGDTVVAIFANDEENTLLGVVALGQ